MLQRLGQSVARHAVATIIVWFLLVFGTVALALGGVLGQGLFDRVTSGAPHVPGSESDQGDEILAKTSTAGEQIMMLVSRADPSSVEIAGAVSSGVAKLLEIPGVESVTEPTALIHNASSLDAGHALMSKAGDGFLMIVSLAPGLSDEKLDTAKAKVERELGTTSTAIQKIAPPSTSTISASYLIVDEIVDQGEKDLIIGEAIALPISLLVMVIIFGGFLAASIPLIGAIASIAGGLASMFGLSYLMDLDAPVVNVVTVLGIGLAIDYGLLIVSRFREELHIQQVTFGATPPPEGRSFQVRDPLVLDAIGNTMQRAGRTVIFSAVIVAISMSSLMFFSPVILRAVGATGLIILLIALMTALTLVPALLALTGRRLTREGLLARVPRIGGFLNRVSDAAPETGFFSRLTGGVQRFPWLVMIAVVGLLLLLAYPVLGIQLRNSTVELLPSASTQRGFVDTIHKDYPAVSAAPIRVIAQTTVAEAEGLATSIRQIKNVESTSEASARDTYSLIEVRIKSEDAGGTQAREVVEKIRGLKTDYQVWTSGQAAGELDFTKALTDRAPWAIAIVILATFVLLFLMTGSILIPIKALLVNVLSLSAALGALVWTFQDGRLEGILGFTSVGGVESYIMVLVLAFGFGISTDYEVFLLARIKELHDEGYSTNESVRYGLQRSGRIITSAALIIIIVFASFMVGDLLVIKQAGFALAIAVLIDATLVRCLLVPATMTILNEWNWWAPRPIQRLHARLVGTASIG